MYTKLVSTLTCNFASEISITKLNRRIFGSKIKDIIHFGDGRYNGAQNADRVGQVMTCQNDTKTSPDELLQVDLVRLLVGNP